FTERFTTCYVWSAEVAGKKANTVAKLLNPYFASVSLFGYPTNVPVESTGLPR
ncbi:unnamed protein product, partial [marine sediment metagenome]